MAVETVSKKKTHKKWGKLRHKVLWVVLSPAFWLYTRIKYGAHIESYRRFSKTHCVVLYNHVTGFDQFFVALSFGRPIYFVATEDIMSNGFVSKLLSYLVAPIPIKKHSTDIKALKTIFSVAAEGLSIAIAPEGNRTYSGRTVHMKESIVSLVRKLKLPIVLFKIEGGYGVQPRWSDVVRRGRMDCRIAKVLKPEDYLKISEEELYELIKNGLYTDEADDNRKFKHAKRAEYLERAMYFCPDCGFSNLESHGDTIKCTKCGKTVRYNEDTSLTGEGFDFPYRFVADWYEGQNEYLNSVDITTYKGEPAFTDVVSVYKVIPYKKKVLTNATSVLSLYGDRVTIEGGDGSVKTVSFADIIGIGCMGRNKLNIDTKDELMQIRGSKRFNALKYLNFCYRYNKKGGVGKFVRNSDNKAESAESKVNSRRRENDKFLGI